MRSKLSRAIHFLTTGKARLELLELELDALRSKLDVPDSLVAEFQAIRESPGYQAVFDASEPLVSICIGTYNRAHLLTTRSLRSALNQTYSNVEVIVVGDHCTDETSDLVSSINDPRLTFMNLPARGNYPQDPMARWMVAGTVPFNTALGLAKGQLITHLDDDDEYLPERIERLVHHLQKARCDLAYHSFWAQDRTGAWKLKRATAFRRGEVTTSSILYHRWFAGVPWDIDAYKYREPGDWNRLRKFSYLGAKTLAVSQPLLRHFAEQSQRN